MVAVFAVGEVHADDIEAILSEGVDCFDGVCLWADRADDGGPTIVLGRSIFGIEGSKPSDLGGANYAAAESAIANVMIAGSKQGREGTMRTYWPSDPLQKP